MLICATNMKFCALGVIKLGEPHREHGFNPRLLLFDFSVSHLYFVLICASKSSLTIIVLCYKNFVPICAIVLFQIIQM